MIVIFVSMIWFPHSSGADINPLDVVISDAAPYHVYPPSRKFQVSVQINSKIDAAVSYLWKDFRGQPLTQPAQLTQGQPHTIFSPSDQIGYYELVFKPVSSNHALPNREPGEERGYGFAIMSPALLSERAADLTSRFGVVHADFNDPYLPPWAKTMTWNTTSAQWWNHEINKRRQAGIVELPIITRSEWGSDDSIPISSMQIHRLKIRVKSYFGASPSPVYWEAGIEENHKKCYREPYYWENLDKKLQVVREAADAINPDIKLIYQIAGLKQTAVENFAKSRASRWIDILSIHPYAWPDFPSPETWHDQYLRQARQQLKTHGLTTPVWYTEVGVTHQGNVTGGFFGYPKKNKTVTGLTHYQAAIYLIKLHVMALYAGIEKIFWYNYRDRKPERDYAENHFGLRDYSGYPKPVYVAYRHLYQLLAGKTVAKRRHLSENIYAYEFYDDKTRVLAFWSYPSGSAKTSVRLASLIPGYTQRHPLKITDAMGQIVPFSGDSITVRGEPLFMTTTKP